MSSESSPHPEENAANSPKLSTEAAMSAATQEVANDFEIEDVSEAEIDFSAQEMPEFDIVDDDTAEEAEAEIESADPSEESEEAADEDADTEAEAEDQDPEAVATGADWNGDPDTVPAELKAGYDRMVEIGRKGIGKLVRQLNEQKSALERERSELTLAIANMNKPKVSDDAPPELPTGDVPDAEWNAAVEKRQQWLINKTIQDKINSGEIVTADQYQGVQQHFVAQQRIGLVQQQPEWSPEVGVRMADLVEQTPTLQTLMDTDNGAVDLYKIALKDLKAEKLAEDNKQLSGLAAQKQADIAKRKAGAAGRAVSRPGSTKAETTPADTYRKKVFRSVDEKLDFLAAETRKELGL